MPSIKTTALAAVTGRVARATAVVAFKQIIIKTFPLNNVG